MSAESAEPQHTVVEVCSARMPTLPSADVGGGKPDPYTVVKLTKDTRNEDGALVMDQIGATRRCEYKTNTLDPSFRFHADMGVEASEDDVLVVELWDYDTFSGDDFVGVAIVRIGDLSEAPKLYQVFGGMMDPSMDSYPSAYNPDWLSKEADSDLLSAWVRLRRCSRRGSGSVDTPGRDNPFISTTSMYFLRHGESEWNKAQAHFDAIGMLSDVDHPLDETGVKQCQEFNRKWTDEVSRREDGHAAAGEAGREGDLEDFLSVDAVYASPLCRATQTCLIALAGHPALTADASKPQLTLLASAREVKKVGGMDTVGGYIGDEILDNVKTQTAKVIGQEETKHMMGHIEADPYDAEDQWWTDGTDRDNEVEMLARFDSFVSTLRFSASSGRSNKPTIVVGHSLFMLEFCSYFMDPDLADADPVAMKLTRSKLSNACMVKLDLEFDDQSLDEIVRIVGVTPMFGLQFHDGTEAQQSGSSLAETLCCCLRSPRANSGSREFQNPMASDESGDREGDSPSTLRMSRRSLSAR